jgi:hypothetical protein
MLKSRARIGLALLLALLAVAGALVPVLGNPGGNPEKTYTLCGAYDGCHGAAGCNTSLASVVMTTDRLVVYTGEPDIAVHVNVTGAEQKVGDPIGVFLFRNLTDPSQSLPKTDGWAILKDPKDRSPGFNYARWPAEGITGNSSASFTWSLQAPPVPGDYRLWARMHTGVDETDGAPLSREAPGGLLFHVVPPPMVEDATPREGSTEVFVNVPIVMVFNKEMDRASVEAAFRTSPSVNGTFTWEGPVARFNVDGFLEEGTTYTYSLDTTALDADGLTLMEPLEVTFTTGSDEDVYPPRVVSVISSRAPLDAIVRIAFNEPMDRASVEAVFSIDPVIAGELTWQEDTLVFTPDAPLDFDTLYTVHIASTAQDLGGIPMGVELYSGFRTVADTDPPRVLATSPSQGSHDVPLVTNLTITFSDDVNTSTLDVALSWDPPVAFRISWDGPTAIVTPLHSLEEGIFYNLTVGTGLEDIRGNPIEAPYVLSFLTAGSADRTPPQLLSVAPVTGSRVTPRGSVRLTFSEPMDRESVEGAIMVSPLVGTELSWSDQVLTVTFEGMEVGTVYTINLGRSMTDRAGNIVREPYALRFVAAPTTEDDRPFFYIEDWLETWWDVVLLVALVSLVLVGAVVQVRWGWRRVVLTGFSWVEERMRTARYLGEARRLYYSINRQMPHSHAERYGSKVVWYWYPFYCLGGVALLSFVICSVVGLVLGLYYVPGADGNPSAAYTSVENIMENVSFGFMFRAIHHWSANILIAAVFLHMLRVYFTGAYRNPRELNWVVGVFLLGLTLFFGYTGYLLPYNQLSYWAGTIGLEMCRAIPLMGDWFAELVFGGIAIGAATLTRMYFFHVLVLPAFTLGLMFVHLIAVYIQGVAEPH